jgi:alpha-ketoglutarate-dependent 2,4-dichlorophenoxyacetate dioxygenase
MTITIGRLTPVFGAEITGVDLSAPLDAATFAQIEEAFETHSVLVFPGQDLDDDAQIAFSRGFGDLEKTHAHVGNAHTNKPVSVISNLSSEGKLMDAEDPRVLFRVGQRNWHSDSSFKRVPAKASLLHARVLPPDGGNTEFACLRAAYDALPADAKRRLADKVAIHHYANSRRGMKITISSEDEDKRFPPVAQAMIRANPSNGRKALFVGAHASHIQGMAEDEGRALLAELLEFATQRDFVYSHRWRVGDLVIYDNRAVLHRATPYAITEHPRVLHRTTVAGDGPTA